ncbi:hypothetical protein J6590_000522 [Homalodisca vitripennis]|nr:hypothetical protein J6590_000522 [Homalodisca vitripennis]
MGSVLVSVLWRLASTRGRDLEHPVIHGSSKQWMQHTSLVLQGHRLTFGLPPQNAPLPPDTYFSPDILPPGAISLDDIPPDAHPKDDNLTERRHTTSDFVNTLDKQTLPLSTDPDVGGSDLDIYVVMTWTSDEFAAIVSDCSEAYYKENLAGFVLDMFCFSRVNRRDCLTAFYVPRNGCIARLLREILNTAPNQTG